MQLGEDALAGRPGWQPSGEDLLRGQWCPYPDDGASVLSSSCARLRFDWSFTYATPVLATKVEIQRPDPVMERLEVGLLDPTRGKVQFELYHLLRNMSSIPVETTLTFGCELEKIRPHLLK